MSDTPLTPGLYIVATPIGNLGDITARAAATLCAADWILAEDKRVSARLLKHIGATAPMTAYHDHSDDALRVQVLARLSGEVVALVSDAGTPLISDPGYKLVRAVRAAGLPVHTLPGPSAVIAAHAPGKVWIATPAARAARINLYPGSEISGVPASLTSAIALWPSSARMRSRRLSSL